MALGQAYVAEVPRAEHRACRRGGFNGPDSEFGQERQIVRAINFAQLSHSREKRAAGLGRLAQQAFGALGFAYAFQPARWSQRPSTRCSFPGEMV